jgi:hypothetical protein
MPITDQPGGRRRLKSRLARFVPLGFVLPVLLAGLSSPQAQTVAAAPLSTTPLWAQDFSKLPTGRPWPDVNGSKIQAHPTNALVQACPSAPPGTSSKNCFKVIYNHSGGQAGVLKQPPSNPVMDAPIPGSVDCDPSGVPTKDKPCVGWVAAIAETTNTATDVTQQDIMINPSINRTDEDPISTSTSVPTDPPAPSYAYTLSYDVYFEPGFDFAKGGKLPGLSAAGFDSGCTDDSSVKRSPDRWSERVMWRENGRIELYSYDQSRPSGNCGIDQLIDAAAGDPAYEYPNVVPGDSKLRFQAGKWYTITLSVQVNDNDQVLYATDAAGATLPDAFGLPIVVGGNGKVFLSVATGGATVGTIQYNNVALRDECNKGQAAPNGAHASCKSPVPDSKASRANGVFFSTFFGGNETKRLTCLNDSIPAGAPSSTTQAIYEALCASQRVAYIWPTNTWVPQTVATADFANLQVFDGYTGLSGTPPTWTGTTSLTATTIDAGEIDLSWTAAKAGSAAITGYKVYSNGGILLGQTSGTKFPVTNIAGTALSPATPYYFFVKAYDAAGQQSAFSNEANATTGTTPPTKVFPPGSVTSNALPNKVNVVFWAPQAGATSYQVYRNGSAIPGASVAPAKACGALPAQQQYYDDGADIGGLAAGTPYAYTVTATNASGTSSVQSLSSVSTPAKANTSGFFVSVTPPYCQTVAPGGKAVYQVNVTSPGATLAVVKAWPAKSTALDFGALYAALPTGVSVSFGQIANDTATMTVTTTSATPPGIYPIDITAADGGVTDWAQFELVVATGGGGDFTLSATPDSLTESQGTKATSKIKVTSTGGFSAPVTLGAAGLPSGVTAKFSANPVTPDANGIVKSTLTLKAASNAALGAATVTVTGTAGSDAHAAPIALTVTK